jgi:hypothetical protein
MPFEFMSVPLLLLEMRKPFGKGSRRKALPALEGRRMDALRASQPLVFTHMRAGEPPKIQRMGSGWLTAKTSVDESGKSISPEVMCLKTLRARGVFSGNLEIMLYPMRGKMSTTFLKAVGTRASSGGPGEKWQCFQETIW